ncbi:MAG: creatininase family protein, partial [Candidatus Ranarchaeia archaeon]
MTYPRLQDVLAKSPVALIPTGSHEQHGPHLPFSTDAIIAKSVTEYAAAYLLPDKPVIVTPHVPYGSSTEHMDFHGTLSIRPNTLRKVMIDLIDSLVSAGVNKILIVNGQGGNQYTMGSLLHEMTRKHGIFIAFTNPGRLIDGVYEEIRGRKDIGGFHACEAETSLLLFLVPGLVDKQRIRSHTPKRYFDET